MLKDKTNTTDTTSDLKEQIRTIELGPICSWGFAVIFFMLAMACALFDIPSYLSALAFVSAGLLLFPPLREVVHKHTKIVLSRGLRVTACIMLACFAVLVTNTGLNNGSSTYERSYSSGSSSSYDDSQNTGVVDSKIFYELLFRDFRNAAYQSGSFYVEGSNWAGFLKTKGIVSADGLLADFEANEVAASDKYDAPWFIAGTVQTIDDDINGATIAIGNKWGVFNINAKFNDKKRVSMYLKGQRVVIRCDRVEESVGIVFARDCADINDWSQHNFKPAFKNVNRTGLRYDPNSEGATVFELYRTLQKAIPHLSPSSECYEDVTSESCDKEIGRAIKIVGF